MNVLILAHFVVLKPLYSLKYFICFQSNYFFFLSIHVYYDGVDFVEFLSSYIYIYMFLLHFCL